MEYGAVLAWWVLLVGVGAGGYPVAATLLSRLPDRGSTFAIPVGLVVLWIPVYWIGHLTYGPVTVGIGAFALVATAFGLAWRGVDVDLQRFLEGMAVFTAGFLFLVAVRAVDPSILTAGGEKFLDFGLLKATLRADRLPPEDMWFAGQSVNYYYGGHLIAASLSKLSGVSAPYAYNLALAGFYGTLLAGAYGLAGSVAAARGAPYRHAGALGAFLVGFASNLVAPLQALLWALPSRAATPIAEAVAGVSALEAGALLEWGQGSPVPFYWISSRVIGGTINEFPLFAFLNGDLQGHMMSPPFLLLAAALGFAYYRTPAGSVRRRRLIVFGATPAVAGVTGIVNMWSFASVPGLLWLALVFGPPPANLLPGRIGDRLSAWAGDGGPGVDPRWELRRLAVATGVAAAVAGLSVAWALPFLLDSVVGAGGPPLGIAFVPDRSGAVEFLLVHGWILSVFALYLGSRALPHVGRRARAAAAVTLVVVFGVLADAAAVALVLPLLVAAWFLLRRRSDVGFETVLFVAGAGLVIVVEVIYLREQAGPGRMNTVFKTYAQVWALWATAAGAALVRLLPDLPGVAPEWRSRVTSAFLAVLLVSVSIYGAVALGGHFEGADDPTLDATTWARTNHPGEWEAIRWLDARSGQPNIVTVPGCWCARGLRMYTWVNAPSTFTGVPTLAGWAHEVGYRGRDAYMDRVEDVWTIYTGPWDERRRLLRAYEVKYVYVGPNEREVYGDRLASFEGHDGVTVAFENGAVTIYEIDRGEL